MMRGDQAAVEERGAEHAMGHAALPRARNQFLTGADAIIMDQDMKIRTQ